jgi:RecA/RadA recombinase
MVRFASSGAGGRRAEVRRVVAPLGGKAELSAEMGHQHVGHKAQLTGATAV